MNSDVQLIVDLLRQAGVSKFWMRLVIEFYNGIPNVLGKPASSSLKYHRGLNDPKNPQTILVHTLEMITGVWAMTRSFLEDGGEQGRTFYYTAQVAVAVHDGLKYGWGNCDHTVKDHDFLAAKHLWDIWPTVYNEHRQEMRGQVQRKDVQGMCAMVAYHNGPWSASIRKPEFMERPYDIVHIVDMMSAQGALKNGLECGGLKP